MKMENNLHVYTGEGKGKTTAAMGLALRSLGHGNRVLVAQFMKNGISGELAALKTFENALVMAAPPVKGFLSRMSEEERRSTAESQRAFALKVMEAIDRERPQTVILDELNVALDRGMLEESAAQALLDAALSSGETVSTGRNAPDWLCQRADYVSRIAAEKHPYTTRKQPARKGVEW